MTKLSRSIFFVSFREKIKSGYDVEIVISNFFTALYFDTGPSPHSVQIIIHLRFYLSTNNRLPFQKPPCTFSSYNATIRASEKYPILSSGNSFFNRRAIRIPSSSSSTTLLTIGIHFSYQKLLFDNNNFSDFLIWPDNSSYHHHFLFDNSMKPVLFPQLGSYFSNHYL